MQQDDNPGGGARQGTPRPAAGSASDRGVERELRRDDADGVLTGVCAGLGTYTGTDPILWRVGFTTTALAGGTGLWLYIAAWIMMRDAGGGPAMIEQLLNRRLVAKAVLAVLGVGLAAATALSLVGGFSWGTLVLATPLILGLLAAHNRGVDLRSALRDLPAWLRSREPAPTAPAPPPSPTYYNPAQPWATAPSGPIDLAVVARAPGTGADREADGRGTDEGDGEEPGPGGPPAPGSDAGGRNRNSRKRSGRRRGFPLLVVVLWAAAAGLVTLLALEGGDAWAALLAPRSGAVYLGGTLLLIGALLVVGAWAGRVGGLIAVGTLVVLALVVIVSVDVSALRLGAASWRPTSAAEAARPYHLPVGSAELDLTELPLRQGDEVSVRANVGLGELRVLAPATARVSVNGWAGVGEVEVGTVRRSGVRVAVHEILEAVPPEGGRAGGVTASPRPGPAGDPPVLVLTLTSHGGEVEVRHVSA
ncbi:PspC domain-containing protein [Marinactinospora rubrisoli]|uniref:PspC domain-containing protein n=1 Tax=Marinactinospora rubrisoli TaxID=2715399 RepID=A0ABW2KJP9_9ACTN